MKKAFLICPVRGHDPAETADFVKKLEADGYQVHWPPRDTPQEDPTGMGICETNRRAIKAADEIFIVWDGTSQGSLFDLGIAFALGKPLTVLQAPAPTEGKSFQNMMRVWEDEEAFAPPDAYLDRLDARWGHRCQGRAHGRNWDWDRFILEYATATHYVLVPSRDYQRDLCAECAKREWPRLWARLTQGEEP